MNWHGGYMMNGNWADGLGLLIFLFFLGALIWLVVSGVHRHDHAPAQDSALEILRARFARGEMTKDEFETAQTVLLESRTKSGSK
jgi:putative membrane protein